MALKGFKKHDAITAETEEHKTRVTNNVVTLYNNYFNFYKKTSNESTLNEKKSMILTSLKQQKMSYQNGWNQKMILMKQRN